MCDSSISSQSTINQHQSIGIHKTATVQDKFDERMFLNIQTKTNFEEIFFKDLLVVVLMGYGVVSI